MKTDTPKEYQTGTDTSRKEAEPLRTVSDIIDYYRNRDDGFKA
ncbi:hypothetical protein [Paenibacillus sp. NFR01]|nr:hypothetical protein [Paenibacillus sp. NFR01]